MITFRVIHHTPGRIRLDVPFIKGQTVETLRRISAIPVPAGIKDVRPNPFTGSVVIRYDPEIIDILKYLKEVFSDKDIQNIIRKEDKNEHP